MKFKVIDTSTGKEVSTEKIESIAKENGLMDMDIDQFFIGEDGQLILVDNSGNIARCNMKTLGLMPVFKGIYPDLEYMEAVLLGNIHEIYPNIFQKSFWAPQAELVAMFPQTWSNTAGGFFKPGMITVNAFITEITTVFKVYAFDVKEEYYGVFFGNRPAYIVEHANDTFFNDLKNHRLKSRYDAKEKY